MNIGLIDVDGHNFPNLALMKISSYHKAKGDKVHFVHPLEVYDCVYKSKIFIFTPEKELIFDSQKIIKGGTGYDVKSQLPDFIESQTQLDYSLYPNCEFSIQFYSRGCIRDCPFCLVHEKEGFIHSVKPMKLNPKGKWIEVLDNNFFANPNWREAIKHLKECNQPVKFHGVDLRIMNRDQAQALASLKLKNGVHVAWDFPKLDLVPKLEFLTKFIKPYKIVVYILIGFNSTREEDLYRVRQCKRLGVYPFVQAYRDYKNMRKPTQYERDMMRWANRAWLFKTMDFLDYKPRKNFICKDYYGK